MLDTEYLARGSFSVSETRLRFSIFVIAKGQRMRFKVYEIVCYRAPARASRVARSREQNQDTGERHFHAA